TSVSNQWTRCSIIDGCEPADNAAELDQKIALIDRGGCEFGTKALLAEESGAIGVIICNFEDALLTMAPGLDGAQVTIPVVFISSVDCATIRQFAGSGLEVTLNQPTYNGPDFLDGDFDNGIIAHEVGHGVSSRIVGGPSNSGCIFNAETASEGISDLMALVMTVREGDSGEQRRGVGTFAIGEPNNGKGIRRFPYSTDMSVNPLTYGDLATSNGVHAIGEIWATVMWDLHWAFVDEYGFDEDLVNGSGGNNMFNRLFIDGMKLAPCGPGYVDLRDAVLEADELNFNGDNQCLIWEVFARRGIGYFADQGVGSSSGDQSEDFEVLPTCIKELKISKTVTPLVEAGDDLTVTIRVVNHKDDAATNVVVTDILPNGTTYKAGSITNGLTANTSGDMLSVELGDLQTLDEIEFSFVLETSTGLFSSQKWYDPAETDEFWFSRSAIDPNPGNNWGITSANANTGSSSWGVNWIEESSQQQLFNQEPITVTGANPVLRFYQSYDTKPGIDGGILEITTDSDPLDGVYNRIPGEKVFRNGYPGGISYFTFVIPNLSGFSGQNSEWTDTYVDLSEYIGEEIFIRFNFGTDGDDAPAATYIGWFIDDIEIMDMINYDTEACVSSDQGDNNCDTAPERGTIVNSQLGTSTEDLIQTGSVDMKVFPNPAENELNIYLNNQESEDAILSILTIDGREVLSRALTTDSNVPQTLNLNIADLAAGFYFVRLNTDRGMAIQKLVIR
ncbi:MAG: M36 family metallopeptidase, partial [Bacteroidota bacterium]